LVCLPLLLVSCTLLNCSAVTRDYFFSVTGVVEGPNKEPIAGARVTLRTEVPVYDAVTPVRDRTVDTDENGGFVFVYIAHKATPYVLSVDTKGCRSRELRAVAPPNQEHVIALDCPAGLANSAER
jgi:hypothetical protein